MSQKVSIIMPVHNAVPYLKECLDSIIGQSYDHWELMVVDDYSTDDSFAILKSYALQDARIKPFRNTKKGIIPALTLAFAKSSGQLITRMDADDRMPSFKLDRLVSLMMPGKYIVTGKVNYFSNHPVSQGYLDYELWLNERIESKDHWKQVYRECVIASPNWLVNRSCFDEDIDMETLVYPEDYDMTLKWYEKGYEIITSPAVTHDWREHIQRTSRNDSAYQQASFFDLKTNRFIENEIRGKESVQLIGAGVKGKLVAKILIKCKVPFQWFDYNSEAFGAGLMGQEILPLSAVAKGKKSILTAWPKESNLRHAVVAFIKEKELELGRSCWLF